MSADQLGLLAIFNRIRSEGEAAAALEAWAFLRRQRKGLGPRPLATWAAASATALRERSPRVRLDEVFGLDRFFQAIFISKQGLLTLQAEMHARLQHEAVLGSSQLQAEGVSRIKSGTVCVPHPVCSTQLQSPDASHIKCALRPHSLFLAAKIDAVHAPGASASSAMDRSRNCVTCESCNRHLLQIF